MTDDMTPVPSHRDPRSVPPYGPPESLKPDIGGWLSAGFDRFGKQPGVYLAQAVAVMLPSLIVSGFDLGTNIATGNRRPDEVTTAVLVGTFLGWAWTVVLTPGLYHTAYRHLEGHRIAFGDLFEPTDRILPYFLVFLLTVGVGIAGLLACGIGLFFAMPLLSHAYALVVVGGRGPVQALNDSYESVKEHYWLYVLWFLVLLAIGMAGQCACYVGTLVAMPVIAIANVQAYRHVFESDTEWDEDQVTRVFAD